MPVGEIITHIGDTPAGFLNCDGSQYLKADYPLLWLKMSEDGFQWEDDADTFLTPDLRGRVVIGEGQGGGLTNRVFGDWVGTETHLLTTAQIPAHNHSVNIPGVVNVQPGVGATPNTLPGLAGTTGNTGGGAAHPNMQPSSTLRFAIRYQ